MLAGYLPFDDDPANPDGDNINLLYKYIVTTPLTFPEYVTPHARDLLRRILVPDPRKRADLFEVARHSWLSDYADIVSHITSSTTKVADISSTTVSRGMGLPHSKPSLLSRTNLASTEQPREGPALARSASVREPPKTHHGSSPSVGGLVHHPGDVSQDQSDRSKTPRDTKRRTVQVEYVAPQSQTSRGETSGSSATVQNASPTEPVSTRAKPTGQDYSTHTQAVPEQTKQTTTRQAPALPPTHLPRSTSDTPALSGTATQPTRPTTGGSMASFNAGRLPSRGSYGQPVAPTVAATNAQGRLAQPKSKQYVISAPIQQDANQVAGVDHQSAQNLPTKINTTPRQEPPKGHKRSNTVSSIGEKLFGRSGSIFGGRGGQTSAPRQQKTGKRYPPTSMRDPYGGDDSRMSMDSRRSAQYGYGRKTSEAGGEGKPRRFSLLPASFSLRGISSSSRSQTPDEEPQDRVTDNREGQRPSTGALPSRIRATSYGAHDAIATGATDGPSDDVIVNDDPVNYQNRIDQQFAVLHSNHSETYQPTQYGAASAEQVHQNNEHYYRNHYGNHSTPNYYDEYNGVHDNGSKASMQTGRSSNRPGVLQRNHRKFADAYEYESHHSGSSGAARKVMDFFRRRAKSRAGDER